MRNEECTVGMKVRFGARNGQKTLGEITKVNPRTASVKTLERRGRFDAGQTWKVPYGMMEPADGTGDVLERECGVYDVKAVMAGLNSRVIVYGDVEGNVVTLFTIGNVSQDQAEKLADALSDIAGGRAKFSGGDV